MSTQRTRAHSDQHVDDAARRFDELVNSLDPATAVVEDLTDLQTVARAADEVTHSEARLRAAVEHSRAQGRSWNRIAIALGVSRQAARQRFGSPTSHLS